ncbi:DNA-processing protein DprA [Bdellovibrionota bacterium FG-2]
MSHILSQFPIRKIPASQLPPSLNEGFVPPPYLYVQGSDNALMLLERLTTFGLSIVGTREPLARSINFAKEVVRRVSMNPLIIVSGFARGIDCAAHQAALESGLSTVAILGCGLDIDYPREHARLRAAILNHDGLLISEFAETTQALPQNFILRNRIIAAWSRAVWVAEAPMRSGALNTAKWAIDSHRALYATPCSPGDPAYAGNQKLLDDGHALPLWGAHSLQSAWLSLNLAKPKRTLPADLLQQSLFQQLHHQVTQAGRQTGGSTVESLLDWAIEKGWTPQEFFSTLKQTLDEGVLKDSQGILSAF